MSFLAVSMSISRLPAISQNPRSKLILLWGGVFFLNLVLIGAIAFAFKTHHDSEKTRLLRTAELANDAFAAYAHQVIHQIDTALSAVRGYYRHSQSLTDTEHFIATLGFDREIIDNLYLIDSRGNVLTNLSGGTPVNVSDRAYFPFHRDRGEDIPFVSPVESGRVTGKQHFRVSRRLDNPDDSFGGIALATIRPEAFSRLFDNLIGDVDAVTGLIGSTDHLLRARWPTPTTDWWSRPIESPLWDELARAPSGSYQNVSRVDGIRRTFVYRQLDNLSLVITTGISETELHLVVVERIRWPAFTTGIVMAAILLLAVLLTLEIRRRDEQDRFMSMLNHELKTPLAVIRMALGGETLASGIRERVTQSINDMNAIIERTLQADRLSHGRITRDVVPCQPAAIIAAIIGACVQPGRVRLEAESQHEVKTDPQLLGVILGNLIDNALNYGAHDHAVRVVVREVERQRHKHLCIEISHPAGSAGMPDPRQVFRKYYRAPGAHGKTGSGLGLHIAAGFARKLGGKLLYTPSGNEVKFALWIPL